MRKNSRVRLPWKTGPWLEPKRSSAICPLIRKPSTYTIQSSLPMATKNQTRMKMKDYLQVRKQRERSATNGSVNWIPAVTVIPSSLTPQHPNQTSAQTCSHKHWTLHSAETRLTVLKATRLKWSDARSHKTINPRRTFKMTTSENPWQPSSSLNPSRHYNKRHKRWWSVMRKSKIRRTMTRQRRRILAMVTRWRRRN